MIFSTANQQCVSRQARSRVVCAAVPDRAVRRAILLGAVLPAVINVPKALALIPDEEDEEMVEKAKANRAKRLAEQRATTRAFLQDEGLANRTLEQELVPVQKAVYKLAQSGAQLESGDVKAASRTLSEGWVGDFTTAAGKVSTGSSADGVLSQLSTLQSVVSKGDLKAAKRSYVALVGEIQAWASTSGLAGSLKGL